jgi:hypothetical protein
MTHLTQKTYISTHPAKQTRTETRTKLNEPCDLNASSAAHTQPQVWIPWPAIRSSAERASRGVLFTKPTDFKVSLADGTTASLQGECSVYVKLPTRCKATRYLRKVKCYVIDMADDLDIILGDDWCTRERATLDFHTRTCVLSRRGLVLDCIKVGKPQPVADTLLSATQARRAIRKNGGQFYHVQVQSTHAVQSPSNADKEPEHQMSWVEITQTPLGAPPGRKYAHGLSEGDLPDGISQTGKDILLKNNKSVFDKPSGLPPDRGVEHVIEEYPGSKPVYRRQHRLSPLEIQEVERQLKQLLLDGLIEPSTSAYGSPLVFVPKKNNDGLRMCVDLRALNKQTIPQRTPIPRPETLYDCLSGSTHFSAIDLSSGYYQIRIAPEDIPKTCMLTPFGGFNFRVLVMGLKNSAAVFSQVMNKVFGHLMNKGVLVYLDDILIYAKTKEEHDILLEKVLKTLKENQLQARLHKCEFEKQTLKYLGHIISPDGIRVDPEKTQAVQDWPQPRSVKDIRSFLGLANYFRKFIPAYASLAEPMTRLTRKNVHWNDNTWSAEHESSFKAIKKALTEAPCLAFPDLSDLTDKL